MRLLYSWEEDKLATIFLSFTTKNLSPNSAGTFKPTIWAATKNFQKSDIFQWRGKNYRVRDYIGRTSPEITKQAQEALILKVVFSMDSLNMNLSGLKNQSHCSVHDSSEQIYFVYSATDWIQY